MTKKYLWIKLLLCGKLDNWFVTMIDFGDQVKFFHSRSHCMIENRWRNYSLIIKTNKWQAVPYIVVEEVWNICVTFVWNSNKTTNKQFTTFTISHTRSPKCFCYYPLYSLFSSCPFYMFYGLIGSLLLFSVQFLIIVKTTTLKNCFCKCINSSYYTSSILLYWNPDSMFI